MRRSNVIEYTFSDELMADIENSNAFSEKKKKTSLKKPESETKYQKYGIGFCRINAYQHKNKKMRKTWMNIPMFITCSIVLIVFTILTTLAINNFIIRQNNRHNITDLGREKVYVTYRVHGDESLWEISAEMVKINPEYKDIRLYADEVVELNNLPYSGRLTAGENIILPCYKTDTNIYTINFED